MKAILIFAFFLVPIVTMAAAPIDVYLFVSKSCAYCEQESYFLDKLKENGALITVHQLEISHNSDNLVLFQKFAAAYDTLVGNVPTVFIGDKAIAGFYPDKIEAQIKKCTVQKCVNPAGIVEDYFKNQPPNATGVSFPFSIIFGAVILFGIIGAGYLLVNRART
jgi:glutaredoxin